MARGPRHVRITSDIACGGESYHVFFWKVTTYMSHLTLAAWMLPCWAFLPDSRFVFASTMEVMNLLRFDSHECETYTYSAPESVYLKPFSGFSCDDSTWLFCRTEHAYFLFRTRVQGSRGRRCVGRINLLWSFHFSLLTNLILIQFNSVLALFIHSHGTPVWDGCGSQEGAQSDQASEERETVQKERGE